MALLDPVIPVTVSVTRVQAQALQKVGRPVSTPISGNALIDTGASICMIDEKTLQALVIPPLGSTPIATPSGSAVRLTYPAALSFPGINLPNIAFSDFVSGPIGAQGIVALLGRNVLIYNGPGGQITLAH